MSEPAQSCLSDADWSKHPDIESMRRMTDGEIKDFLFRENRQLRAAMFEYGQHMHSCRKNTYPLLEPKTCDCGWSEFVAKYRAAP